jgi:hypothetical protein
MDRVIKKPEPRKPTQRRLPELRFRLQVDRLTKASFDTIEAAEAAGLAIKLRHPFLLIAVYDSEGSIGRVIEAPTTH